MTERPCPLTVPLGQNLVLELAKSWLPVLSIVIGSLWGLFTYLDHDRIARDETAAKLKLQQSENAAQFSKDSRTRLIEAQKPFLDKQLLLYFETAQVVGRLVTESSAPADWNRDHIRFEQLYWSELSMVEHTEVAAAMVQFGNQLAVIDKAIQAKQPVDVSDVKQLQQLALMIAHALRRGIESSWGNSKDGAQAIVAP